MYEFLLTENQYFENLTLNYLGHLTRQTPSVIPCQNSKLLDFPYKINFRHTLNCSHTFVFEVDDQINISKIHMDWNLQEFHQQLAA